LATRILLFKTQIEHRYPCAPITNHTFKAEVTFCVRGVISPLLANLFLHYAFDAWMARTFAHIPFERYADDIICHCKSAEEARALWGAIADRFAVCKLVLHPQKTTIVYCKDVNRRGDFPNIHFDFLGFQFRARKIMWVKRDRRIFAHSFQPAARKPTINVLLHLLRSLSGPKRRFVALQRYVRSRG
jgi:RNA-directed DNA polymerase